MVARARLRIMSYGKWSDRMGGADQPYEYVDLYDAEGGELFTWSLDEKIGDTRPAPNSETDVDFTLHKQAKPALTTVKKGERKGETIDYVQEKLKVKVVGFGRPAAAASPADKKAA
ncbi:MAG: hypothetical protein WAN65_10155 [Candidatus Sulfotelmatobacter sp.]